MFGSRTLAIAALFLAASGVAGTATSSAALASAVLAVAVAGSQGNGARQWIRAALVAVVFTTLALVFNIAPPVVALLPTVLVVLGAEHGALLALVPVLVLATNLSFTATILLSHRLEPMLSGTAPLVSSLVVLGGLSLCVLRGASGLLVIAIAAALALFTFFLGELEPSPVAGVVAAILVGAILARNGAVTTVRRPMLVVAAATGLFWWAPYGHWALPTSTLPVLVLAPPVGETLAQPFQGYLDALRYRFPALTVAYEPSLWTDAATVLVPMAANQSWDERSWQQIVDRTEATRSHLVLFGEHTDFAGLRERARSVWAAYQVGIGDDTTVPRPNRDLIGEISQSTLSPWPRDLALNRGASITLDGFRARPVVVGRDWFADRAGLDSAAARLGDLRPSRTDLLGDVVLMAYGVSASGASLLSMVADNSMFTTGNVLLQPAYAFARLASLPWRSAVYDAVLLLLALIVSVPGTRQAVLYGSVAVLVGTSGFLVGWDRQAFVQRGTFDEADAATSTYAHGSTGGFRQWWIQTVGDDGEDVRVVIGDWARFGELCESRGSREPLLFVGIPTSDEACGATVEGVFRFGKLNVPTAWGDVPVQAGAWGRVIAGPQSSPVAVLAGTEMDIVSGAWTYNVRRVAVLFDEASKLDHRLSSTAYDSLLGGLARWLQEAGRSPAAVDQSAGSKLDGKLLVEQAKELP